MAIKHRTEITIETYQVTVFRLSHSQTEKAFCERCQTALSHFSVLRAAALMQLTETAIFRLIESKQIHATENAAGMLLVCSNSLAVFTREMKGRNK